MDLQRPDIIFGNLVEKLGFFQVIAPLNWSFRNDHFSFSKRFFCYLIFSVE